MKTSEQFCLHSEQKEIKTVDGLVVAFQAQHSPATKEYQKNKAGRTILAPVTNWYVGYNLPECMRRAVSSAIIAMPYNATHDEMILRIQQELDGELPNVD